MKPYRTKTPNYDLTDGDVIFDIDQAVRCTKEKCTIEVLGTDMVGELQVEVSASGESFAPIEDLTVALAGDVAIIPLSGITIGSYIKIRVSAGTSGTLSEVRYLFG